ncbi:unnamed protein product, partial [Callosobruchus maculatus]
AERLADYGRLLSSSQPILNSRRRDLDRIQDLFPNDNLGLHLPEPSSTYSVKTKSFRKKSVGDLTALDNNNHHGHCNRIFLVEAPCVMSPANCRLMLNLGTCFSFPTCWSLPNRGPEALLN